MLLIHASFIYKQNTENAFKIALLSVRLKMKILLCEIVHIRKLKNYENL